MGKTNGQNIKNIEIKNYKSIKDLSLSCKRVNIFVGEPNAGKTNVLEILSFLAIGVATHPYFKDLIRFNSISDLFYDSDLTKAVSIKTNLMNFELCFNKNDNGAIHNNFKGTYSKNGKKQTYAWNFILNHDGNFQNNEVNFSTNIMFYQFRKHSKFNASFRSFLSPPFGDNIPTLLISSQELKKMVSGILKEKNLKLLIMPITGEVFIGKQIDEDIFYTYPYNSLSDTLQRIIFFLLAIETSNGHVLIFDEPESNMFPFYTKQMAEKIAKDTSNQYFMTTHNPYLIKSIIKNTPENELAVNVVYMENFETKMKTLSKTEINKANADSFFDLEKAVKI